MARGQAATLLPHGIALECHASRQACQLVQSMDTFTQSYGESVVLCPRHACLLAWQHRAVAQGSQVTWGHAATLLP